MVLTLIGMSGVGKTYWADRLSEHGYARLDCDALVAAKLRAMAGPVGATRAAIGQWMGFPDDSGYQGREALYRSCEAAAVRDVLIHVMEASLSHTNWVIDTGGSAIYAGAALFRQLRRFTSIVYLELAPPMRQQLIDAYLAGPHPLIWDGKFRQLPGETREAAVRRCYAQLLGARERLYEQYSDVTLAADVHRSQDLTAAAFVRAALSEVRRSPRAPGVLPDAAQPDVLSERLGLATIRW